MATYPIDMKALCALVHLSGKNDIRACLNGVNVEFRANETVYTATNGSALGSVTQTQDNEQPATVIIPRSVIERIKLHKSAHADLHMEDNTNRARLVYPAQSVDVGFAGLDGKFPDWCRVVPEKASGEAGNYDVDLLALFAKANKVFRSKNPGQIRLEQNGPNSGAIVRLMDTRFIGVVMPFRI